MLTKNKKLVLLFFTIATILGLVIVLNILNKSKTEQIKQSQQLLIQEASAHYSNIKNLQIWHNKFGGIFKNDYKEGDYHFNIYSLNPKNRENKAKGFAKEALDYFEQNRDKEFYYQFTNDNKSLNFIGVLNTKQSCTKCHTNYKVGDVRGGIEIKLPFENYNKSLETISSQFSTFYLMIISFFLLGYIVIYYFINVIFLEKDKIEELNNSLEKKVLARTEEIKRHYNREHYLKELLETISELNESLISSYSLGSIIEKSLQTLQHHQSYKMILFGNYNGKKFIVKHIFGDKYNLIKQDSYELDELKNSELLKSIYETTLKGEIGINNSCVVQVDENRHNRSDDYTITSSISVSLKDKKDTKFDILTFFSNRVEGFDSEEISILNTVAKDIMMALSAFKQRKITEKLQEEQITNYEETILAFVDMIEQRDAYTAGHTIRVAQYSRKIAQHLNIEEEMIKKIEKAAILHDIGKIATPDTILLKPAKLNSLEYDLIKNHVVAGYKMLSKVKMYASLAEIMKYHHEHYDGTGYPYGLKKDKIPLESHILIVADAFDAMTTNRIYKPRLTTQIAIEELKRNSGTQFHPKVVEAATLALKDIVICQTSQTPKSELEKQRFSYFFNDSLTDVYNDAYLNLILNQIEKDTFVKIIKIKNFSLYNKNLSWKKGNSVLIHISNRLKEYYPNEKVFRFEGDDFMVLSSINKKLKKGDLLLDKIESNNILDFEIIEFEIKSKDDIYKFDNYIDK